MSASWCMNVAWKGLLQLVTLTWTMDGNLNSQEPLRSTGAVQALQHSPTTADQQAILATQLGQLGPPHRHNWDNWDHPTGRDQMRM
jgi:hypothetical protein